MDFPLDLNSGTWMYGIEEMKQVIEMVLVNPLGSFLQSHKLGSLLAIHSSNIHELDQNVRNTLKQVPGITIKNIVVGDDSVSVYMEYNNQEINYQYTLPV